MFARGPSTMPTTKTRTQKKKCTDTVCDIHPYSAISADSSSAVRSQTASPHDLAFKPGEAKILAVGEQSVVASSSP
jgi:hypothetical protein